MKRGEVGPRKVGSVHAFILNGGHSTSKSMATRDGTAMPTVPSPGASSAETLRQQHEHASPRQQGGKCENAANCWGCGAEPGERPHLRCGLCIEKNLVEQACYCSKECQAAHWKVHKRWHAGIQQREDEQVRTGNAELAAAIPDHVTCDYERILKDLLQMELDGVSPRKVAKGLRRLIKLVPREPAAHRNLAVILEGSGDMRGALQEHLKVKDLLEEIFTNPFEMKDHLGISVYAETVAKSFELLCSFELRDVPKPRWWKDMDLLDLSAKAVTHGRQCPKTWFMRGMVLSAIDGFKTEIASKYIARDEAKGMGAFGKHEASLPDSWGARPRTMGQLCEAIVAFLCSASLEPPHAVVKAQIMQAAEVQWAKVVKFAFDSLGEKGVQTQVNIGGHFGFLWKTLGIEAAERGARLGFTPPLQLR